MNALSKAPKRAGQILSVVILSLAGGIAAAQAADDIATSSVYSSDSLTFERWCSEIQHFDAARCAARGSADVATYQLAKDKLETYEIQYDRQQRRDREFNESFSLYQSPNLGDPLK